MRRIAVDIGGTFTDIVYIDEDTMQITVNKTRSTPWDIGKAVLNATEKIKVDMSEVTLFIHGTTVGINTVVQRKGAKVGLITTRGFRDVLEMARGNKKELYNYMWKKPKPLVPRYLRMEVNERTSPSGEILKNFTEVEVKDIVDKFKANEVEAIAVCLINSYSNPKNEKRLGEVIKKFWPDVTIALSHLVASEIREYERTSTTVINAYIEKVVVDYLGHLNKNLKEFGFNGQLLVLGPSGVLGIKAVRERSIYTLASGPIGGAAGAASLASLCGEDNVVTMDVGGTSFDVSVIKNGINVEKHQTEIMGYPVLMAGMDIRPIGAGGGSIARVDAAGLLTVGPNSAGANPGPMAYGLGGNEPTVTDAAIVNGIIDPGYFLGGEITLNYSLAKKGIANIADKLGISVNKAAAGIISVARNNMINETTEILVGQGSDPRDFTLMSYGGAGGIFAANLAKDMQISRVLIPQEPGVFSARGILAMHLVHTYSQAYINEMSKLDLQSLADIYRIMEENALDLLKNEGVLKNTVEFLRSLDICYEGQRYYVETPIPGGQYIEQARIKDKIKKAFEQLYEVRYGHLMEAPLLTINARLKATGRIKEIPIPEIARGESIQQSSIKKRRKVFLIDEFIDMPIYERGGLLSGNIISGPAIIEEPFHTTVMMPGQTLEIDKYGNLIITHGGR